MKEARKKRSKEYRLEVRKKIDRWTDRLIHRSINR